MSTVTPAPKNHTIFPTFIRTVVVKSKWKSRKQTCKRGRKRKQPNWSTHIHSSNYIYSFNMLWGLYNIWSCVSQVSCMPVVALLATYKQKITCIRHKSLFELWILSIKIIIWFKKIKKLIDPFHQWHYKNNLRSKLLLILCENVVRTMWIFNFKVNRFSVSVYHMVCFRIFLRSCPTMLWNSRFIFGLCCWFFL